MRQAGQKVAISAAVFITNLGMFAMYFKTHFSEPLQTTAIALFRYVLHTTFTGVIFRMRQFGVYGFVPRFVFALRGFRNNLSTFIWRSPYLS